jgi:alkylated DNA repair protein (DNA oxidative demethylase)
MPEQPPEPRGLVYQPDFITKAEERQVLDVLETMEYHTVTMHGRTARRTVRHFGLDYGYPPGSTIGWHRDAPMFGPEVVGVSLAAACRRRFQRGKGEGRRVAEVTLEPRSAYVLSGAARFAWQHSIPPTRALRYSITFRTVKAS